MLIKSDILNFDQHTDLFFFILIYLDILF